jgi:putative Mg2+ transporter-C (MgtC) family protein
MSLQLTWGDVLLRLIVTIAAAAAFGIERGERGKPAGLRTTMLVGLAASVTMILVNFLLASVGKTAGSFVQIDPMRLPLGVLSGVGFIGAGTIIQRRELVVGVTTAATLWFVTVVGLCIGGGRIALGVIAAAAGLLVLWGLEIAEPLLPREFQVRLVISCAGDGGLEDELLRQLRDAGLVVAGQTVTWAHQGESRETRLDLRWRRSRGRSSPPSFVAELAQDERVLSLCWDPIAG